MPVISKSESRPLTLRQKEGRAVNAVAELLRKTLSVPNIYLEPHSPQLAVDILAVDRAGSGDLHGVEIKIDDDFVRNRVKNPANLKAIKQQRRDRERHFRTRIKELHRELMSLPAHYRYLAVPQSGCDTILGELRPLLHSPDGIGKIGIISITDHGEELPIAEIVIAPERFRVDAAKLSKIEKNLINNKKVRPDIEVRI